MRIINESSFGRLLQSESPINSTCLNGKNP